MASQSQRSRQSTQRPPASRSHRDDGSHDGRRLQDIIDRKAALDLQQEELDKQYAELDKAENDLLSQRGSASRSGHRSWGDDRWRPLHVNREPQQSRSIFTKDLRKRMRSPSKRDRENRDRRERGDSHSAESPPVKNFDQYYGKKKPRSSPFIKGLADVKIDRKLKVPHNLEMYDGTGDPHDHTFSFEEAMCLHGHDAGAMCHFFSSTLKRTAREWYISLQPNSIDSWETLQEQFCTRFGSNKRPKRTMTSLLQVKQKPNESLRQFIKRFQDAISEINGIDSKQVVQFLMMGLNVDKSSRLIEELISKPPESLPEAYDKVDKFVELEEALANLRGSTTHLGNPHPKNSGGDAADSKSNNKQGDGMKEPNSNRQQNEDSSIESDVESIPTLAEETKEQCSDS